MGYLGTAAVWSSLGKFLNISCKIQYKKAMENAPGDFGVNFPIEFYRLGIFVKSNETAGGRSYGGGASIYLYIYIWAHPYQGPGGKTVFFWYLFVL